MDSGVSGGAPEGAGTYSDLLMSIYTSRIVVSLGRVEMAELRTDKGREAGRIGWGSEKGERGVVQRGSHTGQRRRWSKGRRALGSSERGWREARLRFECLIRHNSRDVSKSGSVDRQELDQHMATPCCVVRAISLL